MASKFGSFFNDEKHLLFMKSKFGSFFFKEDIFVYSETCPKLPLKK